MEPTTQHYPQKYLTCPKCGGDVEVIVSFPPGGEATYCEFCVECDWEYIPANDQ
jgi:hypothetical protein